MVIIEYKPTHWWKREIHITIPLWPRWLAQRLCDHRDTTAWFFNHDTNTGAHTTVLRCSNCYKIYSTTCKHPFKKWEVLTWEEVSNKWSGTSRIPSTWYCTDCGYSFTKEIQCPECHVDMEITEWMGLFSSRFRCSTCGMYYFREDLDGCNCNKEVA